MITIIKKYYFATFAGIFVATFLKGVLSDKNNTLLFNLQLALLSALVLSLVVGTLYYLQDRVWGPKKRNKLFDKAPFRDLVLNGFVREDDAAIGVVDGYTVAILYTWPNGGSAITVTAFYNVAHAERYIGDFEEVKRRNTNVVKKGIKWSHGAISDTLAFAYRLPDYDKIMNKAGELTAILKADGLMPEKFTGEQKPKPANGEAARFGFIV